MIDALGTRRRFVGPYYPGAGATPLPTGPLSVDELADTVVAAAEAARWAADIKEFLDREAV